MRKKLATNREFARDMKRVKKRRKDMRKIEAVIGKLERGECLALGKRVHRLKGSWAGFWECHVEDDWLLVWRVEGDSIVLTATGTHSDLFRHGR